ncbi:thioesterase family protein [Wenyingzhuangia sp. 2_MG-2023]|uniref:acyl-CoA thioesterase n=1 Tax=Wenyingzhuangia sp. 2_MG-2023 TaxID=3062639 RepID=UPI0026E297AC|nr:thioesterase family protein [Wenyingzhuangia sp. 2_MG-2023]MDO6736960.1 thioesterase family protein [Wenyingzhuangia sp. 2_MG-2023]MDO6801870.1 thioesterase family protein [Wenyingzhuangia sp. 1_MG-2023]
MNPKFYTHRVKYYETDQMQYVHHSNYAKHFETARIEWLRDSGISYKSMEDNGVMLPVVNLNINFKKPAKYDDVLTIKTALKQEPNVKIIFTYEVYNQENELLTTAESTLVFVDMKKNKPIRCPEYILNAIMHA